MPSQDLTLEELNAEYEVVDTSLWDWPVDLTEAEPGTPLEGDCQTYAKTVKGIEGVSFPKAIMIRCWSPLNRKTFPYFPRHAVMFIWGKGFIDSTNREYRWTPWPHIPAWPVGFLIALPLLQLGEWLGWWNGLVWLALWFGLL